MSFFGIYFVIFLLCFLPLFPVLDRRTWIHDIQNSIALTILFLVINVFSMGTIAYYWFQISISLVFGYDAFLEMVNYNGAALAVAAGMGFLWPTGIIPSYLVAFRFSKNREKNIKIIIFISAMLLWGFALSVWVFRENI